MADFISSAFLQDTAVDIARQVAATQRNSLRALGRRVAAQAIYSATDSLPGPVRSYLQPGYIPPPPQPQWVTNMLDPFINPMLDGAKEVALTTARRTSKPLYLGLIGGILTLFALGYMFGSKTCKRSAENAHVAR